MAHEQRRRRRPAVPKRARAVFLEAIANAYSVTAAAERAGVHRNRFYELRDSDAAFAAEWASAYEAGTDVIRDEIRRRAVDGWDEPVFQRGELVGHVRRFSDRLLELEAKRRDQGYRENPRLEVAGHVTHELEVQSRVKPASLADVLNIMASTAEAGMGVVRRLTHCGFGEGVLEWARSKNDPVLLARVEEAVGEASIERLELPPAGEIVDEEEHDG